MSGSGVNPTAGESFSGGRALQAPFRGIPAAGDVRAAGASYPHDPSFFKKRRARSTVLFGTDAIRYGFLFCLGHTRNLRTSRAFLLGSFSGVKALTSCAPYTMLPSLFAGGFWRIGMIGAEGLPSSVSFIFYFGPSIHES